MVSPNPAMFMEPRNKFKALQVTLDKGVEVDLGAEMPWGPGYPREPYGNTREAEESDALQEPLTADGDDLDERDETGLYRDVCVLVDRFSGHPSTAIPIHNRSDLSDAVSRVNATIYCCTAEEDGVRGDLAVVADPEVDDLIIMRTTGV